jgi:uncharacterized membrane protein
MTDLHPGTEATTHTHDARAALSQAKQPKTAAIAGPYGHPFHPMLVTVPIGAWIGSVVLDIASRLRSDAALATGADWMLGIGIVSALAAATVGFLDYLVIPRGTRAHRVATTHMLINLTVTVGFVVDLLWRWGDGAGETPTGPLVLSVVLVLVLAVSGALGGELAYRYGVRVAGEDTQVNAYRRG